VGLLFLNHRLPMHDKYRSKRIGLVESLLYLGGVAVFCLIF
jgi:hypothetical protein